MTYEELLTEALENDIDIVEFSLKGQGKGYYCDNIIIIDSNIHTNTEKKCILAEELGHHFKNYSNIIKKSTNSLKQENLARRWGHAKLISIFSLLDAFNNGITSRFELAKYLAVTEEFLQESIETMKAKYGTHLELDNYIIYFEPYFGVLRIN
ncbi:ImmA/IrrE family metallo-endopeptidase [Clostridium chauvoei]|uniref:ImmA/IrrE family metallo-endopeptidase n=1 Tax=Clostridium chauvoei TaxID=46867 RepID=UPI001C8587AA|nr:ImmA/IrrE family metallo-endopeptidase [Clostridium chauvoei]MBX7356381.1 ImmA/IrrE family metallo-endopeptidase [Clostridium chauvoei]MBX7358899.1 ImmA/IrrE family metallo-endopeptidase [Clostridium chauvoei]